MSEKNAIPAYPLYWPDGRKRTRYPEPSRFKSSFAVARDELVCEIERLRGNYYYGPNPILSTNVALRNDGVPYANRAEPDDSGVAVYFQYKKKLQMCFACDKYAKVWENFVAIRKTIEAIRGIERWGSSDMMERAFQGFVALPSNDWRSVLCVGQDVTLADARSAYRRLAATTHPDKSGGDTESFQRLNAAWRQAERALV